MRFFIKAKATKYIKRWKGKDGSWQYKYPPKKTAGSKAAIKEAKPERKMVMKDEPGKAPLMSPDGEVYITSNMSVTSEHEVSAGKSTRFKIPKKYVKEIFEWGGMKFAIHRKTDKSTNTLTATYAVSELSSGAIASTTYNEIGGLSKLKDTTIKQFEEMGVEKVKSAVDSFIKAKGGAIWELENAYNFDSPIIDVLDPEAIHEAATKILKEYNYFPYKEDLESVKDWVTQHLDNSAYGDPISEFNQYSSTAIEIALRGIGDKMEPMSLEDAAGTVSFLEEVHGQLSKNTDSSPSLYAIATWAQKQNIDMAHMMDEIYDWEYTSDYSDYDTAAILWDAYESDTDPDSIIEKYKNMAVDDEDEDDEDDDDDDEDGTTLGHVEGETEIAGAMWNHDALTALGSWVSGGGGVSGVRSSIVKKDLEGFPVELKQKLGYEYFDRFKSNLRPDDAEAMVQRVVGIADDVLYRSTHNKQWINLGVGEVLSVGMASFSRSQETQFGDVRIELVIPPPLRGIPVDDISNDYGDIAAHYGINGHPSEHEIIIRAPFLQVVEKTSYAIKVRAINDPQVVLTSLSQGEPMEKAQGDRLFSDDKPTKLPIIIRDDPKMYASLHADLNRPLSDRGKGKRRLIIRTKK